MLRNWVMFSVFAWCAGGLSIASGQSLLEQLEKKVREGLELAAPKQPPAVEGSPKPTEPTAPGTKLADGPAGPRANDSTGDRGGIKTPPPPPVPKRFGGTEELPAPAKSAPVDKTAGREAGSDRGTPPADAPGTKAAAPSIDASATDRPSTEPVSDPVYLGLEAESLTGGGIGTRVVAITENSPAWRAGFRVGDVILALDGHAIAGLDAMVERLALKQPGQTMKVLVMRGNRNMELTCVLQNAAIAQRIHGFDSSANMGWLGVAVADLSSAFRNQFGLKVQRAAAVTNVTKGSPADMVKIQPGDAIIAVDGLPIESSRALLDWIASKRAGDLVNITVMRGVRPATFSITLGMDPRAVATNSTQRGSAADPFAGTATAGSSPVGSYPGQIDPGLNIVPAPIENPNVAARPGAVIDVGELRGELQSAKQQLAALEQRIAEIEALLGQAPR